MTPAEFEHISRMVRHMNAQEFKLRFPNASAAAIAANSFPPSSPVQANKTRPAKPQEARRGRMNKTESEYALILEAMRHKGEILRWEFEGITLRWGDMKYTPDFVVFPNQLQGADIKPFIALIEVKGAHIWDRDIVRFKGARAYWPEFAFEMHQKTKDGWKRLLWVRQTSPSRSASGGVDGLWAESLAD